MCKCELWHHLDQPAWPLYKHSSDEGGQKVTGGTDGDYYLVFNCSPPETPINISTNTPLSVLTAYICSLSLSVTLSQSFYFTLCIFLSLSFYPSLTLCLSRSLPVSLSVSFCHSLSLPVSLPVSLSENESLLHISIFSYWAGQRRWSDENKNSHSQLLSVVYTWFASFCFHLVIFWCFCSILKAKRHGRAQLLFNC